MRDVSHYIVVQALSDRERKVKMLQDNIHSLIVMFVDNGDELVAKVAKGIERDIKDVLRYVRFFPPICMSPTMLQHSGGDQGGIGGNHRARPMVTRDIQ